MPDIETLMQGWSPEFEDMLKEVKTLHPIDKIKAFENNLFFFLGKKKGEHAIIRFKRRFAHVCRYHMCFDGHTSL
jgi:hypothetical protein